MFDLTLELTDEQVRQLEQRRRSYIQERQKTDPDFGKPMDPFEMTELIRGIFRDE